MTIKRVCLILAICINTLGLTGCTIAKDVLYEYISEKIDLDKSETKESLVTESSAEESASEANISSAISNNITYTIEKIEDGEKQIGIVEVKIPYLEKIYEDVLEDNGGSITDADELFQEIENRADRVLLTKTIEVSVEGDEEDFNKEVEYQIRQLIFQQSNEFLAKVMADTDFGTLEIDFGGEIE